MCAVDSILKLSPAIGALAGAFVAYYGLRTANSRTKYGIIYEHRFQKCCEIYTRLSRMYDAADLVVNPSENKKKEIERHGSPLKRAGDLKRTIRQNDALFDAGLAAELGAICTALDEIIFNNSDKSTPNPTSYSKEYTDLLSKLASARDSLAQYMRKEFGDNGRP